MFHIKKLKATKIKESYICIKCLEVLLKGNCDEKYTSLCRKAAMGIRKKIRR